MLVDQVGSGTQHRFRQTAFDLLDDQRADDLVGQIALLIRLARHRLPHVRGTFRSAQRQQGQHPRVRFVDIFVQRLFHLRRQIVHRPVVPQGFARRDHPRGQLVQMMDDVRPVFDRILAADRFDLALAAVHHAHADAVAADDAAPLVDDRVSRLAQIQILVDHAGEVVGLGPQRMPVADLTQLASLQPFAGQFAHLHHELQITALRHRLGVRPLKNLDQPLDLIIRTQGCKHQQRACWIADRLIVAAARLRRNQMGLARSDRLGEQSEVPASVFGVGIQQRLAHLDLVGQIQAATFPDDPHGAADRGQRRDDLLQERRVVGFRLEFALRQLSDLADQTADLLFGLFDGVCIQRRFGRHSHAASRRVVRKYLVRIQSSWKTTQTPRSL